MMETHRRRGRPTIDEAAEHQVREKLIQAAIRQFSQQGYGSTTLRALADEAGVNISLVSYYFGSKDGLYRSAISQFGRERLEAARKVLIPQDSLEGVKNCLLCFLGELFGCYVRTPDLVRLIYRESDACSPQIQEIFRDTFFQVYQVLTEFLKSSQERGFLNKNFDPQIATSLLLSGFSQAVRGEELSKELLGLSLFDLAYRKRLKEQTVSIVLFGLSGAWTCTKGDS